MPSRRKLIMILIDGVSADYVRDHAARLPHLSALAERGTSVTRLGSTLPATSMPGRATMLTGVGAERHGAYGNHIYDGDTFRCTTPGDLRAPTIGAMAKDAGLDVACVGHAMLPPEDAHLFRPPWWLRGFMDGSRFAKIPAEASAAYVERTHDPDGRLDDHYVAHPLPDGANGAHEQAAELMTGMASDQVMMQAVASLACSDRPPDLILSEIGMTDAIQHQFGYESGPAHWSIATADTLVGALVQQFERQGRADDYVLAVTSDHGHGPIDTAIYADKVLPETMWESEGATLHVRVESADHAREVAVRLAEYGAEPEESRHVPAAQRDIIATFSAPHRHSFEHSPAATPDNQPTGRPTYVSTHGHRPGDPADDRFCIFAGPGVPQAVVERATAEQFTPSLAAVLGLPLDPFPARPIDGLG